jgi:hypothetical protein
MAEAELVTSKPGSSESQGAPYDRIFTKKATKTIRYMSHPSVIQRAELSFLFPPKDCVP